MAEVSDPRLDGLRSVAHVRRTVDINEIPIEGGYTEARRAADTLEEDLLACFPFTGGDDIWSQWRAQAIAALPEELRGKSEYRRFIEEVYERAAGLSKDFTVDLISRPPVGGYSIGGIGFTDIDDKADASLQSPEFNAASEWLAFWKQWRGRAIEALPESARNDANYLSPIDTTYGEMVKLARGTAP